MVVKVYEGIRRQITSANSVVVNFHETHATIPVVNIMIEGTDAITSTASVEGVSTTGATVRFSSTFTGYLHLHAFSS